jgi:hypothetical protein
MKRVTKGAGSAAHFDSMVGEAAVSQRRRLITRTALAGTVAAALVFTACSSDSKGSSAVAATTPPTTAAPATTSAPVATEAPTTTEAPAPASPEVDRLKTIPPLIDAMVAAASSGDVKATQEAYEQYDAGWNGIEVYVNIRSQSMYLKLEADLQGDIEDSLTSDAPDLAKVKDWATELGARFADAIAVSENGPALSPLVDDVTTLRIIRADLRLATAALGDGDVAKAKDHYMKFKENFDSTAEAMLGDIDADAEKAAEEAVDAAADAFANASTSLDDLKAAVGKATSTYNFGVSLLNASARAADDGRTGVTTNDLIHLGQLYDVQIQLMKSMKAWTAGDYETAGALADTAINTVYVRVQARLAQANGADVALTKLLGAYKDLAAAAGDAKAVGDANKAAINGAKVAMHALMGQFWTDPKVQTYLDSLPEADPLT